MATSTQTPAGTAKEFQRRQSPLLARYAIGMLATGVITPAMRVMDSLGVAERMMGKAWPQRERELRKKNPFGGYVPGEHDVIVATYAKSGTNWMMQIVHQLAFHGMAEFEHIHCVVPWPDYPPQMGQYAIPVEDNSVWMAAPEKKRAIKTHLNWDLIPYSEQARYIMVIRDPKDVFVSNYHFSKGIFAGMLPSLETWYRLYLSGKLPVGGSWAVNAAGYWAQRHRPNIRVLSFKSMKRDLPGTVRRVAEFMKVHASDAELQEVCHKASFEYMKTIDAKFGVWNMIPWNAASTMIRRGAQGGSAELLTRDQQREIDNRFQAELRSLGSDFPYEEFCDLA